MLACLLGERIKKGERVEVYLSEIAIYDDDGEKETKFFDVPLFYQEFLDHLWETKQRWTARELLAELEAGR